MSEQPTLPADDKIIPALVHHFTPESSGASVSDRPQLIELLRKLPSLSTGDQVDLVTVKLKRHNPGASFTREDLALLHFVDDATTQVLHQTDLDFKIEAYIRDLAPLIAAELLEKGLQRGTEASDVYSLVDLLIRECIGWREDLGFLGQQFVEKINVPMSALAAGRLSAGQCIKELKQFFKKEEPQNRKREQRLCDRELKVLAGMKANYFSTELINREMTGKKLPLFIIFMLQGPWFEFLQQVYVHYGENSKQWQNVGKMTEALVWSLQPAKDRAKQANVMKSLPARVRDLCADSPFDTEQVINSLDDLETEYEAIRAGQPSDPCDFELLESSKAMANALQSASSEAVKAVSKTPVGQWFLYDDPAEPDEKVARIMLILNWEESEQLLLTNQNRRKVVHMSYSEMANHLASGVLKKLNPRRSAAETFRNHLFTVLKAVSDQNKKEKQIAEREQRRAVSTRYTAQRKEDLERQLQLIEKRAEQKKQRAMVLRHKAQKKQQAARATVESLRQDAWVKLPVMEGTLTPCKLVAIIPGNDTYIFANRAGLKVAEYTGSQ
ncbi:MAG: DUF1631 family protein, partial [Proteobacteria bacterium]|nr:DUF1631 family protein [Pseudomonadota bacterium]